MEIFDLFLREVSKDTGVEDNLPLVKNDRRIGEEGGRNFVVRSVSSCFGRCRSNVRFRDGTDDDRERFR